MKKPLSRTCRKCGDVMKPTWHLTNACCPTFYCQRVFDFKHYNEHLHWHCTRCTYDEIGETLDHKDTKRRGSK